MTPRITKDPRLVTSTKPQPIDTHDQRVHTPPEPTEEQALLARIAELESQLAQAQVTGLPRELGLRVAPKGGVSVYGINANFPVTLYAAQWYRIRDNFEKIDQFIQANLEVLDMNEDTPEILKEKESRRVAAGIVPRKPETVRQERIVTATTAKKAA